MNFPLPLPMRQALNLAAEAAADGEVPVGAVVTLGDEIVAETRNAMRGSNDPTAHAEMEAIRAAGMKLGTSRLDDCILWVTLEPCAMCAAAVAIARLKALRFARKTQRAGALSTARASSRSRPVIIGLTYLAALARWRLASSSANFSPKGASRGRGRGGFRSGGWPPCPSRSSLDYRAAPAHPCPARRFGLSKLRDRKGKLRPPPRACPKAPDFPAAFQSYRCGRGHRHRCD